MVHPVVAKLSPVVIVTALVAGAWSIVETTWIAVVAPHRFAGPLEVLHYAVFCYGHLAVPVALLVCLAAGAVWLARRVAADMARGQRYPWHSLAPLAVLAGACFLWLSRALWFDSTALLHRFSRPWWGVVAFALGAGALVGAFTCRTWFTRLLTSRSVRVRLSLAVFSLAMIVYWVNARYFPHEPAIHYVHLRLSVMLVLMLVCGVALLRVNGRAKIGLSLAAAAFVCLAILNTTTGFSTTLRIDATLKSRSHLARAFVAEWRVLTNAKGQQARPWSGRWRKTVHKSAQLPQIARQGKARDVQHIVWISIDSLRVDDARSAAVFPSFAKFLSGAVLFERGYSNHTSTLYSLPSIATSQLRAPAVAPGPPTTAELLKRHGFATIGLFDDTAKWIAGKVYGQGFDTLRLKATANELDDALATVSGGPSRRLFIWLHTLGAHMANLHPLNPRWLLHRWRRPTYRRNIRERVSPWFASVVSVLKKHGVFDTAMIVVFSDHAEAFGEHGRFTHGTTPYEEVVRIPIAVRMPQGNGRVINTPVSALDIAPTTLAAAGVKAPRSFHGQSLLAASSLNTTRPVMLLNQTSAAPNMIRDAAIIVGGWKLLHNRTLDYVELYDLTKDPWERNNLADEHADKRRELMALIQEHAQLQ